MRLRGIRVPRKALAGLWRCGSRGGSEGIWQSRTHARRIARCPRRLARLDSPEGVIDMKAFPRFSDNVSAVVGFVLLLIPTYFVAMSALRYEAPGLRFFGTPLLLLAALAAAVAVNAVCILSVKLEPARPPVLRIALSLRVWNLGE